MRAPAEEDEGRREVADPLSVPVPDPRPQRHDDQRRHDQGGEEHVTERLLVHHVRGEVLRRGQHRPGGEGLDHERAEQETECACAPRDGELAPERVRGGIDRVERDGSRAPEHPPAAEHPQRDDQRHPDGHHQVARRATVRRIAQRRGAHAEQQDPEGEEGHPPRHHRGALLDGVGDLRRHRDVRDLEHGEGRCCQQEEHEYPQGGDRRAEPGRGGERQDEDDRQEEPADEQERASGPEALGGAIAHGAHDGQEHHVPQLRDQHDNGSHRRCHAEAVRQVVGKEKAGHRGEPRRAHRAEGVAEIGSASEGRVSHDATVSARGA